MTAEIYRSIIYRYMAPFAASNYDLMCVLQQDNDTKHNAAICREALENLRLNWVT